MIYKVIFSNDPQLSQIEPMPEAALITDEESGIVFLQFSPKGLIKPIPVWNGVSENIRGNHYYFEGLKEAIKVLSEYIQYCNPKNANS